jgi:hypothetical protein
VILTARAGRGYPPARAVPQLGSVSLRWR